MLDQSLGFRMAGSQRGDEHKVDATLFEHVTSLILDLGLKACISDNVKAVGVSIKISRLTSVSNEESDVIDLPEWNVIFFVAHGRIPVCVKTF
jgi:hypothetical protein